MYDIKQNMGDTAFEKFHTELDDALTALQIIAPEKLRLDTNGTNKSMFITNIPTFIGYNTVAVFTKGSGEWAYDKVTFEKAFIGGLVIQTGFQLLGDDKHTVYCPDYANHFMLTNQRTIPGPPEVQPGYKMGYIEFIFSAINGSNYIPELSYIYNDYSQLEIPKLAPEDVEIAVDRDTGQRLIIEDDQDVSEWKNYHYTGYALYVKEIEALELKQGVNGSLVILDSGHIIVTIDNIEINNAVYPWLMSENPVLKRTTDTFPDGEFISELSVVTHGADGGLLPNQLLLYPSDLKNYNGFCLGGDYFIYFDKIYIFQKRSFTEEPPVDSGYSLLAEHEDQRVYTDEVLVKRDSLYYELRKFHCTSIISAVFKGRNGREVGQAKTKMVTWVKQPMCPDVEIKYEWKNDYTIFENIPNCRCHGEWHPQKYEPYSLDWYSSVSEYSTVEFRTPYCGDHDLVSYSTQFALWNGNPKTGPMWYPYNKCKGYQSYEIITAGVETAMEIMSEFTIKSDGEYIHGQHDLRMLGPDVHIAWEDGWCPIPSWCSCGMPTWNKRQNRPENNTFSGYAYIRSGVSNFQLNIWERLLEELPRFGNSSRSAMRTYRSMDKVQFYYNELGLFPRTRQWLPAQMYFTDLNITKDAPNEALAHYSSGYGNVVEALGLMAFSTIDGVYINETIDYDNRFRFDQVFRTNGHHPDKPIAYPDFVGAYDRYSMPWYEYLPYPNKPNKTIHWAWREVWAPLERRTNFTTKEAVDGMNQNDLLFGPYIDKLTGADQITGYLFPFVLTHPDYLYDEKLKEIRLVCDEGNHFLKFKAPMKDENTGEYTTLAAIQLDDGPYKYFSVSDGDWESPTDDKYNEEDPGFDPAKGYIYDETDATPWINTVNLYTEESDWESDTDRTFDVEIGLDDDDEVITEERYFNRGLFVYLVSAGFKFLPANIYPIITGEYNAWTYPDQFNRDEATGDIAAVGAGDLVITFEFDNKLKTVIRLDLTCTFGYAETERPTQNPGEGKEEYNARLETLDLRHNLYHWPAFDVYYRYVDTPVDDQSQLDEAPWVLLHEEGTMLLANSGSQKAANRTETYIFNPASHYLGNGTHSVVIIFRNTPTRTEEEGAGISNTQTRNYKSSVRISDIEWFEHKYVNATEGINTYERKYYVSYGDYGYEPPQGGGDKDGLLGWCVGEMSTVWQRDHRLGILDVNNVGIPDTDGELTFMNKCRGRFVFDIEKEYTPIPGSIWEKEKKQTEMYNKAISKSQTNSAFENIKLPVIDTHYLGEHYLYRNYRGTSGYMVNTLGTMPLTNLIRQEKYSPGGHLYVPLWAHETICGKSTFYYGYIAVSSDSSADLLKYSADTNSMTQYMLGPHTLKGLGTISVDPRLHEQQVEESNPTLSTYLYNINEVTRYASGEYYLDFRLSDMAYLIHYVYPSAFGRYTGNRIFNDEITELILGPNLRCFRYFPDNTDGWHDGYDKELIRFNLFGGVKGRYWGPDFSGIDDPASDLVWGDSDMDGVVTIPFLGEI
jgi:hypothetical protein